MSDPFEATSAAASAPQPDGDPQLDALRAILLEEERHRLHQLEQETAALHEKDRQQSEALAAEVQALQAEIKALRQTNQQQQENAAVLRTELARLQEQMHTESRSLVPKLIQQMGFIITNTIRDKRDELAEALGPIMSDAIRVQIRDSRKEMVEALYPIILETVMKAVREFLREFQRNIDARLKSAFSFRGLVNRTSARLRGVSASELTLRESFAFSLEELFLIQHESGLLLAHHRASQQGHGDSDLISGMLTAIRDFARDSFGDGDGSQELREIEFGDERIIIQSGQYVYAAAVIKGIEATGFHARLQELVAELHIQHKPQLRDYRGDPATLPNFVPRLETFAQSAVTPEAAVPPEMSRNQRWLLAGGAGITLLLTAVACFYLQFTIALWPVAFGPTPTATPTVLSTATPTLEPTSTLAPTATPTFTLTPTPTATATSTPTNTSTPTPTATTEPTNSPSPAPPPVTVRDVWLRDVPDLDAPTGVALPQGTAVTILVQAGDWVEVAWEDANGDVQRGWLGVRWLAVNGVPLSDTGE
ncbi:MAG: hypothetical protein IPM53_19615 [Anaerolineaceae bacterium]|nr:hypothetical protein [Anaerolineaceae bacterium]